MCLSAVHLYIVIYIICFYNHWTIKANSYYCHNYFNGITAAPLFVVGLKEEVYYLALYSQ